MKNKKTMINMLDYYKQKCFSFLGLINTSENPNVTSQNLMYVNNINEIQEQKLREYNTWYAGDGDALLNLYTGNMLYEYNTEPLFDRNKRSYFWSVSATEDNIKRTHSGQPRNIVDTLVNIVGVPKISVADEDKSARLEKILDDNNFSKMFLQTQLPRTLVEGWGCYKIDYDSSLRDTPIINYYRANEVEFIYKSGQLIAILFKNYYTTEEDTKYLLVETRRQERKKDSTDGKWHSNLLIEKELFRLHQDNTMIPCGLKDLPQLEDIEPRIVINDYPGFLAVPSIIFDSDDSTVYGRSIYTGKIDMFDDLDQCLSQASNTVRRSTTHVYINNNYLDRDTKTGMPIMPSNYDCDYVMLSGSFGPDGSTAGQEPVTTIQPNVSFGQYDNEAISLLINIVSGIMSPATLGIDIAKKDNAEAQREKEKVTVFTRNTIIAECTKIVKKLCTEVLCADALMNNGEIKGSEKFYDINCKFDEFADASFEAKAETLIGIYQSNLMTPELFIESLYGDSLSEAEKQKQIEFISQASQAQQNLMAGEAMAMQQAGTSPDELAMMGAAEQGVPLEQPTPDEAAPELVGTASNMRK